MKKNQIINITSLALIVLLFAECKKKDKTTPTPEKTYTATLNAPGKGDSIYSHNPFFIWQTNHTPPADATSIIEIAPADPAETSETALAKKAIKINLKSGQMYNYIDSPTIASSKSVVVRATVYSAGKILARTPIGRFTPAVILTNSQLAIRGVRDFIFTNTFNRFKFSFRWTNGVIGNPIGYIKIIEVSESAWIGPPFPLPFYDPTTGEVTYPTNAG